MTGSRATDAPALGGLRLADHHVAVDGDQGATHREPRVLEVDVTPAQADGLTSSHPGHGDGVPERREAIISDGVEERLELLLASRSASRGCRHPSSAAGRRRRVGSLRCGPT